MIFILIIFEHKHIIYYKVYFNKLQKTLTLLFCLENLEI
jgi:hypothetical protein